MQGTSLTKQERGCKLYDAFDKFTHIKGESLHLYYLRFTQLINDMNIYNMNIGRVTIQPLQERQNSYAADPCIVEGPVNNSPVITHNACLSANDWMHNLTVMRSLQPKQVSLMPNLSSSRSDVPSSTNL
ncbi:hypothetical protein Tco_0756976 [Tanacetum coccineum]